MLEGVGMPLMYSAGGAGGREQRRPMWTQHEKAVLRLLMRQYAGVTEFDPPDVHKHPIRNEMWRLLTARYNAHPHVRSRDTKQLRKAWENLKYRARKLGSENQRSGRQQNNAAAEASWPLDGVTLPGPTSPPPKTSPPAREAGEVGDWKEAEEDHQTHCVMEKVIKDEVEDESVSVQEGPDQTPPPGDRGSAVLNLHPLVTSLLGGGLGSLASTLPFLASPTSGLFLPQAVALSDSEHCNTIMRASMDSGATTTSPLLTTTTSDITITTSGAPHLVNGMSHPMSVPRIKSPNSPALERAESRGTSLHDQDTLKQTRTDSRGSSPHDQDPLQQRLSGVEASMRHSEEQHQVQLQLLRLQMAQAVTEHEAKMRVLGAQLEYWQRRLRGQQQASNAHTSDHLGDPELEDDLLP